MRHPISIIGLDLVTPEKSMVTRVELEGLQTEADRLCSHLSLRECNTIENPHWPLWIPKVISSATAWICFWKSLKIYCQKLVICIKGRITQYLLQCLIVLPSPASAQSQIQAKLRHTVLNHAKPECRFLPTSSSG